MKGVIIFTVLTIVSYGLYRVFLSWSKGDKIERTHTSGTITKVIQNEVGGIYYYIKFINQTGNEMEGQSIEYKRTFNKYHVNDPVDIKYFIAKNGRARIIVKDSELEPYSDDMAAIAKNTKIASILFFIIAVICLIQYIVMK